MKASSSKDSRKPIGLVEPRPAGKASKSSRDRSERAVRSRRAVRSTNEAFRRARELLTLPIGLFILWELVSRLELVPRHLFPPPSQVLFVKGPTLLGSPLLYESILASLGRVLIGWTLACLFGVVIGMVTAYYQKVEWSLSGSINAGRSMPPAALVPVLMMWIGTGSTTAIALIIAVAIWPVIINTVAAVEGVPILQREVARTFGATPYLELKTVVLPSALPAILVGARIAMGTAWMAVVLSELVGIRPGLGYMLSAARIQSDISEILFIIVVLGVLAIGIDYCFQRVTRHLVRYK